MELVIVVAIIGVLAAVAMPLFNKYKLRARESETSANIHALVLGVQAYYAREQLGQGVNATVVEHCVPLSPAPMWMWPTPLPDTKARMFDFQTLPHFRALGFQPDGPVYAGYNAHAGGYNPKGNFCSLNNSGTTPAFQIYTKSDYNGDGVYGHRGIYLNARDGELYRSGVRTDQNDEY